MLEMSKEEELKEMIIGKSLQNQYLPGSDEFSTQQVTQYVKCTHMPVTPVQE